VELYLVQHGEATAKDVDPERPLTETGRTEVAQVARAARAAGITVATVGHSGKLRAEQTADIMATELSAERAATPFAGLAPNDPPGPVRDALLSLESPAMLVGHLPSMSRLCSLLLVGEAGREIVHFRMGGIVCLATDEAGQWRLRWMLTPELVPDI
jgi:phosphohistidine phosphatase